MIRKATLKDIDLILTITKDCAQFMINKGIYQWNDLYPSKDAFKKDLMRGELYVIEHQYIIMGCVVISTYIDEEYRSVKWLTPNGNSVYIHRLAIHPNYQKQGFAQELMTFSETYAKTNNYLSVRLDTFSQNKNNQHFYEQRGYQRLETINYPQQSEHDFYCYELVF